MEVIANNLYGGTLFLGNGFTSVFQQYSSQMNRAGNALNNFNNRNRNSASETSKSWNSAFSSMNSSLNKFSNNTLSTIAKITAGWLSVKGAISGIKEVLKSGSEFQNASTFLKAVYGDKLGVEKFKWATNEANATPFTEREVASGLARAHSLGLADDAKSFKMYEDMGSFAKIQGVGDLNSAIDAIVDAQAGEWIRLQTITGIKREGLEDFAKKNNLGKFTNKKGQVTDSQKLMEVLQKYMDDKGITGMTDKFSKTLSGRLSTLKGNFMKTMADIGGINAKGEVEDGSLFDQAGKGLERFIESINKFSKSKSFDKIQDALGKIGNAIIEGFDYLTTHPETVERLLKFGGALVGLKVVTGLVNPFLEFGNGLVSLKNKINIFTKFLNGVSLKNPTPSGNSISNFSNMGKGLLSLNKKVAGAGLVIGATGSLFDNDGLIHKGFNNANPVNWFNKSGEKEDYMSDIFGYTSKASTWVANKIGLYSDKEANLMYEGADKYMKNANDYLNGKTDVKPSIPDIGQNVVINIDKIEKDADADGILMKLINILNKNKTRNSVSYP